MPRALRVKGAVYVNGTIAAADKAVIPVYDHGLLVRRGRVRDAADLQLVPFLFERHCNRLRASAKYLNLEVPFTDDELRRAIDETTSAAGQMTKRTSGSS